MTSKVPSARSYLMGKKMKFPGYEENSTVYTVSFKLSDLSKYDLMVQLLF